MAIRLGHNCINCSNLKEDQLCGVHNVKVGMTYTCDSFDMKAELSAKSDCTVCARYEQDDCANPTKAAPDMMCSVWAPVSVAS